VPDRLAARLSNGLALALVALACATPPRPLVDADQIAGARALDTSFRVKDRVAVPGPHGAEYTLPIGEYRPGHIDAEGVYYAAPQGLHERAGFAKRTVAGGVFVPLAGPQPWEHASIYIDRDDGRTLRVPIPPDLLDGPGALRFAVKGEEQGS